MRIDLGYGEEVLLTPEKQSVNDLLWHELRVVRSRRSIKLILNREDVATGQIHVPSKVSPDFDINLGVFVGGTGMSLGVEYLNDKGRWRRIVIEVASP